MRARLASSLPPPLIALPLRDPPSSSALRRPVAGLHAPAKMALDPLTATASDLQAELSSNSVSSRQLVDLYLGQIRRHNGYLKAVIATAPEELLYQTASGLDEERRKGNVRGPLHGIPIVVKDNIATEPGLGLPTTCGSLALVGSRPRKNAIVIDRLIAAGTIILGKANLSEWAWCRSEFADSGWSAVGGQTQSAYVRGGFRDDDSNGGHSNPGGSSSGSAVAVSAGLCPISIGTETMGSLIMPSDRAALYTIKPTLKLVPQEGIIPVTFEADSAGPMAKSVLDLANLLDVLVDPSKTNIPVGGYKSAVTRSWNGVRIGFVEPGGWLFPHKIVKYEKEAMDQMMEDWAAVFEKLKNFARVKPIKLISIEEATEGGKSDIWNAFPKTFERDLRDYLANIDNAKIASLEDLIKFNNDHSEQEMPSSASNQVGLIKALNYDMTDEEYRKIISKARDICGKNGIDRALEENNVDIIIGPGDGPMFHISGTAGYPGATLPLGCLKFNGRPFGLQMVAKAHQEPLLIQVQSAWEKSFPARQPPPI